MPTRKGTPWGELGVDTQCDFDECSYDSANVSSGYEADVLDEAEKLINACDDFEIDGYLQFIKDMQEYPVLDKEQEAEKFRTLNSCEPGSAQYKRCREELINANLRLVISVVSNEFRNHETTVMSFQDMIQEGTIGLNKAIEKFDVKQGYKFSTYATPWIRQSIQRAIADHGLAYRLTPNKHAKLKRVMAIRNRMECELGRLPTTQELAAESGIRAADIDELVSLAAPIFSIDMTFNAEGQFAPGDGDITLGAKIADEKTSYIEDNFAEKADRNRILDIAHKCLNKTAYMIFEARHLCEKPESFESIGTRLGCSREYIRKIDALSINMIRYIYQKGHAPPKKGKFNTKSIT